MRKIIKLVVILILCISCGACSVNNDTPSPSPSASPIASLSPSPIPTMTPRPTPALNPNPIVIDQKRSDIEKQAVSLSQYLLFIFSHSSQKLEADLKALTDGKVFSDIYLPIVLKIKDEKDPDFPYNDFILKEKNGNRIFPVEKIKQFSHELLGKDWQINEETNKFVKYNEDKSQYESTLEFGIFGDGPAAYKYYNIETVQNESQKTIEVKYVLQFINNNMEIPEYDNDTPYIMTFKIVNEEGRTFLRYVSNKPA